jgi:hypothetical protein
MIEFAETLQARYYEQSASDYDSKHNASEEHEHNLALQYTLLDPGKLCPKYKRQMRPSRLSHQCR